jgi:hypothetical protein
MMTETITAAAVAVAESNSDSGGKPMPLKELFPLHHLHGEAPSWIKLSQIGCHQKALVIMWQHTKPFA